MALVGLVFALPFLLIVPIAGNFADKFSKRKLIVYLKALEVAIMAFGIFALHGQSSGLLYLTMFLMSAQSAFFGPCKYGILPEQVGIERLSKANGSLQLFTFLAIICGTVLAPELSLLLQGNFSLAASVCLLIAAGGFLAATQIEPTPSDPQRTLRINGFASLRDSYRIIRKDGFLTLAVLAIAVFSLMAAFVQLNILDYGAQQLGLQVEQATRLFLLTAIGIGVGSTLAGWLSGRSIEFGIVPIGAAIISLCLLVLGTLEVGSTAVAAFSMFCLGIGAGLFIVPLESFIQYRSPKDQIGSLKAASSFLNWVGILLASGLIYLNSSVLEWGPQHGFFLLSGGIAGLAIFSLWVLPEFLLKFILMLLTRFCYSFKVRGLHNISAEGPALLICNNVSLMDAVLITTSQQRRVRMLMSREYYENSSWLTRKVANLAKVILIHSADNPKKLIQSLKSARAALDEGYLVCIFAEGSISRTGMMRPFKPGFERIIKGSNYPIIPVYIGGAWGSLSSFYHGTAKLRPISELRYQVSVHFGPPLPTNASAFEVQQAVSELSGDSFELVKATRRSLGHEFIKSARGHWNHLALAESSGRDSQARGHAQPTNQRQPQLYRANHAIRSAQNQCEIRSLLTSRAFLEHLPELPLMENVLFLEDLLAQARRYQKIHAALRARFLPISLLCADAKEQADEIATVLFSSGSTAEPKGVMLSHHNILSNIESFRSVLNPERKDVMLASLPYFHSFGYTVNFWFPLLSGMTTACHPNPLEAESIGKLAQKYRATILLTTPSFLLAYTRKIKPEQFAHLRYVFTGAEKLQPRVAQMFEKRFGIQPLEGYGATELSTVCAISLPNVVVDTLEETGNRAERLGRVLPGMALKIIHPDTRVTLPPPA